MVDQKRPNWMIMPVTFTRLIGGDYYLLAGASTKVLQKYYLAAISLIVIMLLSISSTIYAMEMLINQHLIDGILTVFLVSLIACMYIFLLNTFSKDAKSSHSIVSSANCIRFFFVVFMAFLISRPLATYFLESHVNEEMRLYKDDLVKRHNNKLNAFYNSELTELSGKQKTLAFQLTLFPSTSVAEELSETTDRIAILHSDKTRIGHTADVQIQNANFFLYRMRLSFNHSLSWLITVLVVLIFLSPAYLIYSIDAEDVYYEQKKNRDNGIVTKQFQEFTDSYKTIFKNQWALDVTYYTVFKDAPFNQIRKKGPDLKTSEQFLHKFFNRNK
jgi:hypothetical protein